MRSMERINNVIVTITKVAADAEKAQQSTRLKNAIVFILFIIDKAIIMKQITSC